MSKDLEKRFVFVAMIAHGFDRDGTSFYRITIEQLERVTYAESSTKHLAPKEGWVSVEDADLSKYPVWLCYCWSDEQKYGLIDSCQCVDGDFGMMDGWRVTHVRPLPPAPTQEGEER